MMSFTQFRIGKPPCRGEHRWSEWKPYAHLYMEYRFCKGCDAVQSQGLRTTAERALVDGLPLLLAPKGRGST
jgi:hypothetical protein